MNETTEHWDRIYATKSPEEVSWTQPVPQTSLALIQAMDLPKTANIIDVGGGESRLVDHLLDQGFEQITVLDISAKAIEKAKQRLGEKAARVHWVVGDIIRFEPDRSYDLWHDRAAFHFVTTEEQVAAYLNIAEKAVTGFLLIATFSTEGPQKCSGLAIQQYSEATMRTRFQQHFEPIRCLTEDHKTPFGTTQNFVFCSFRRR